MGMLRLHNMANPEGLDGVGKNRATRLEDRTWVEAVDVRVVLVEGSVKTPLCLCSGRSRAWWT